MSRFMLREMDKLEKQGVEPKNICHYFVPLYGMTIGEYLLLYILSK